MTFRPCARVVNPRTGALLALTADQAIASGVLTALSGFTEAIDTDGFYSGAAPDRVTVPAGLGGVYAIMGYPTFTANATGSRRAVIRVNGVDIITTEYPSFAAGEAHCQVYGLLELEAGDVVQLMGRQDSGVALNSRSSGAGTPPEWSVFELFRVSA